MVPTGLGGPTDGRHPLAPDSRSTLTIRPLLQHIQRMTDIPGVLMVSTTCCTITPAVHCRRSLHRLRCRGPIRRHNRHLAPGVSASSSARNVRSGDLTITSQISAYFRAAGFIQFTVNHSADQTAARGHHSGLCCGLPLSCPADVGAIPVHWGGAIGAGIEVVFLLAWRRVLDPFQAGCGGYSVRVLITGGLPNNQLPWHMQPPRHGSALD